MRSLGAVTGRLQCHCHCRRCINDRHVHVRKLLWTASRLRAQPCAALPVVSGSATSQQQERGFRSWPQLLSDSRNTARIWDRWRKDNSKTTRKPQEEELANIANGFNSLSIDHWSLDDVVQFEPKPGGLKPPIVPSSRGSNPDRMMPQSPWASDALKRGNYSRVWTPKKIAKMETSIAKFVLQVCRLFRLHSQRPSNLIVLPEAIRPFARLSEEDQYELARSLISRKNLLCNRTPTHVPANEPPDVPEELRSFIPQYEQREDGLHHDFLRDLNASLIELFEGYNNHQLDFLALLVKVCHNLLVSSAPPNVQTMNILLLGFSTGTKYIRPAQAQVQHLIMDWLVTICMIVKIRPNEVTCAIILAMYRRRGMHKAFTEFVMLMRGMARNNALMFTKPLSITRENAARLTPTKNEPFVFKQSVSPSPMVFAEVIKGVSKFYNLRDAVSVCKEFSVKDWGYDWNCLRYLLEGCITERDWESGLWVWSEVGVFREAGHEEPAQILATMLALCVQCEKQEKFAEVLEYSKTRLKNITPSNLIDISTKILHRAVDRMDEEELQMLQLQEEAGYNPAQMGLHDSGQLESKILRRLDDDRAFRRAVFGFAPVTQAKPSEAQEHKQATDPLAAISLHIDAQDEALAQSHTVKESPPAYREQGSIFDSQREEDVDLASAAEGGFDIEEDEVSSVPKQDRGEIPDVLDESPMTIDGQSRLFEAAAPDLALGVSRSR